MAPNGASATTLSGSSSSSSSKGVNPDATAAATAAPSNGHRTTASGSLASIPYGGGGLSASTSHDHQLHTPGVMADGVTPEAAAAPATGRQTPTPLGSPGYFNIPNQSNSRLWPPSQQQQLYLPAGPLSPHITGQTQQTQQQTMPLFGAGGATTPQNLSRPPSREPVSPAPGNTSYDSHAATSSTDHAVERAELHKLLKSYENVLVTLDEYRQAQTSLSRLEKKLSKGCAELSKSKAIAPLPSNALQLTANILEARHDASTKYTKIVQKEYDALNDACAKYFRKVAKEERTHDDLVEQLEAKVRKAQSGYEKTARKNAGPKALEAHDKYIATVAALTNDIARAKTSHALSTGSKSHATNILIASTLGGLAETSFRSGCETVRKTGGSIGPLMGSLNFCSSESMPSVEPADVGEEELGRAAAVAVAEAQAEANRQAREQIEQQAKEQAVAAWKAQQLGWFSPEQYAAQQQIHQQQQQQQREEEDGQQQQRHQAASPAPADASVATPSPSSQTLANLPRLDANGHPMTTTSSTPPLHKTSSTRQQQDFREPLPPPPPDDARLSRVDTRETFRSMAASTRDWESEQRQRQGQGHNSTTPSVALVSSSATPPPTKSILMNGSSNGSPSPRRSDDIHRAESTIIDRGEDSEENPAAAAPITSLAPPDRATRDDESEHSTYETVVVSRNDDSASEDSKSGAAPASSLHQSKKNADASRTTAAAPAFNANKKRAGGSSPRAPTSAQLSAMGPSTSESSSSQLSTSSGVSAATTNSTGVNFPRTPEEGEPLGRSSGVDATPVARGEDNAAVTNAKESSASSGNSSPPKHERRLSLWERDREKERVRQRELELERRLKETEDRLRFIERVGDEKIRAVSGPPPQTTSALYRQEIPEEPTTQAAPTRVTRTLSTDTTASERSFVARMKARYQMEKEAEREAQLRARGGGGERRLEEDVTSNRPHISQRMYSSPTLRQQQQQQHDNHRYEGDRSNPPHHRPMPPPHRSQSYAPDEFGALGNRAGAITQAHTPPPSTSSTHYASPIASRPVSSSGFLSSQSSRRQSLPPGGQQVDESAHSDICGCAKCSAKHYGGGGGGSDRGQPSPNGARTVPDGFGGYATFNGRPPLPGVGYNASSGGTLPSRGAGNMSSKVAFRRVPDKIR